MEKVRKTTAAEFRLFKMTFMRYAKLLGLHDWQIHFSHEPVDGCFAEIHRNLPGRVATVFLASEIPAVEGAAFNARRHGKHEAIHLFLERLCHVAKCRYTTPDEIDSAEEGLVRVLEKLL